MKYAVAILLVIILAFVLINSGGNTSTSENVMELAKVTETMSKINTAIDVAGDSAFNNVRVEVENAFKGEVEQAPSLATTKITEHVLRKDSSGNAEVSLKYSGTGMSLNVNGATPTGDKDKLYDMRLPVSARKPVTDIDVAGISRPEHGGDGIPPILKDEKSSKNWIEQFLFSESGLAMDRLEKYNTVWEKLKGDSNHDTRKKFLEWVLGNNGGSGEVEWLGYKLDRLVAFRQIDVDALTGIDKNNRLIATIIDPNRAYLYEVHHVNMTNLSDPIDNIPTELGVTADQNIFVHDLARHLNQMLGGKIVVIPNNDSSLIIDTDGNPVFFLN